MQYSIVMSFNNCMCCWGWGSLLCLLVLLSEHQRMVRSCMRQVKQKPATTGWVDKSGIDRN